MENKITEEQLTKIQDQQKELNNIIREVGILETQKHGLLHEFGKINKSVEEFKIELQDQYGNININVEDGTYTAIEQEEKVLENV